MCDKLRSGTCIKRKILIRHEIDCQVERWWRKYECIYRISIEDTESVRCAQLHTSFHYRKVKIKKIAISLNQIHKILSAARTCRFTELDNEIYYSPAFFSLTFFFEPFHGETARSKKSSECKWSEMRKNRCDIKDKEQDSTYLLMFTLKFFLFSQSFLNFKLNKRELHIKSNRL